MPNGYYQLDALYEYDGSDDVLRYTFWNETDKKHTIEEVLSVIRDHLDHGVEWKEIRIRFVQIQEDESRGQKI